MLTLSYSTITNVTMDDNDARVLKLCYQYNHKVEAIKYVREKHNLGLKFAKDVCDQFWDIQRTAGIQQHWSTKYLGEHDCMTRMNIEAKRNSEPSTLGSLLRNRLEQR